MKKYCTFLFILLSTIVAAQSIHIFQEGKDVTNGEITIPIVKGEEALADLSILNTTSTRIGYQINRTILNPPLDDCGGLSGLYFCTALQCYFPNTFVTWTPPYVDTLEANELLPKDSLTTGLAAHYNVCPTACHDLSVLYRVYTTLPNSKDTAYITINYSCSTGITQENNALGSLSNAYPNPANTSFSVNYALPVLQKSQLIVYDLFGRKMLEHPLNKREGMVTFDTSTLVPGVYFYSLMVADQRAVTRQLVISR